MNLNPYVINGVPNGATVIPLNLTDHLVFMNAKMVAIVHKNRKQAVAYTGVNPEAEQIVKGIFGEDLNITRASAPKDLCLLTWDGKSPFPQIRAEQTIYRGV